MLYFLSPLRRLKLLQKYSYLLIFMEREEKTWHNIKYQSFKNDYKSQLKGNKLHADILFFNCNIYTEQAVGEVVEIIAANYQKWKCSKF